jgi:hypothetical protein
MVTDGAASGPGAATGTIPVLTPRGGGVEIRLDEHTGLPATFAAHAGGPVIPLRFGIELETDGDERTGTTGGLAYVNSRSFLPEIRLGRVDYEAVSVADVAIYGVLRHDPRRATLVAVTRRVEVCERRSA